jgi:hypothetical protein
MMRNRARGFEQYLMEEAVRTRLDGLLRIKLGKQYKGIDLDKAVTWYGNFMMSGIQTADIAVTTAVWKAKYDQVFADMFSKEDARLLKAAENEGDASASEGAAVKRAARAREIAHERAREEADKVIRRTQPMFDKIYQPKALRTSNPLYRMFNMFTTQQSQNFNNLYERYKGKKDMDAVWLTVWQHLLPAVVFTTLSAGRLNSGDGEDWWDFPYEDWIDMFMQNHLKGVPLFGDVGIAGTRWITNIMRDLRGRQKVPYVRDANSFSPVLDLIADIKTVASGEMKNLPIARDWDIPDWQKKGLSGLKLATQMGGVPGWTQTERLINAWTEGDVRRAAWPKSAIEGNGEFKSMADRLRAADSRSPSVRAEMEYQKFDRWYRGLTDAEKRRFNEYYGNYEARLELEAERRREKREIEREKEERRLYGR